MANGEDGTGVSVGGKVGALPVVGQAERLVHEHLSDGEAVMHLKHTKVLGGETYTEKRRMSSLEGQLNNVAVTLAKVYPWTGTLAGQRRGSFRTCRSPYRRRDCRQPPARRALQAQPRREYKLALRLCTCRRTFDSVARRLAESPEALLAHDHHRGGSIGHLRAVARSEMGLEILVGQEVGVLVRRSGSSVQIHLHRVHVRQGVLVGVGVGLDRHSGKVLRPVQVSHL